MSTKPTADPAHVLFGRSMRAILALLFGHPEQAFYLREIARTAGAPPSSLQRELSALTAAGLLLREERGNQVHFRANPGSPLFADLQGIVVKSFGVRDVLRDALTPLAPKLRVAFIYGSIARGEARPESDIDVMVIGDPTFAAVVERMQPAEARLRRSVNATVYPGVEFAQKLAAGNPFLSQVLEQPKIFLIGGERELRDLAQGSTRQAAQARPPGRRKPARALPSSRR